MDRLKTGSGKMAPVIRLAVMILLLLVPLGSMPAAAKTDQLRAIQIENLGGGKTGLELRCVGKLLFTRFTLHEPRLRLVFDIENMKPAKALSNNWLNPKMGEGHIAGLRVGALGERDLRLVLDLNKPVQIRTKKTDKHRRRGDCGQSFELSDVDAEEFVATSGLPAHYRSEHFADQLLDLARQENKKLGPARIIIDPGHGGRDPGTIGKKGTREKDVTLIAALALENELVRRGYEVHLTRRDDQFLTLIERVERARGLDANLFISLHADAGVSPSLQGASVYTLDKRKQQRARNAQKAHDWSLEVSSEVSQPVAEILEDLAQRNTTTASQRLAKNIISEMAKQGPVLKRSHRQAGFVVLFAPDVPAVLLEMGFLSNKEDERKLMSLKAIKKKMKHVAIAIDDYFEQSKQSD